MKKVDLKRIEKFSAIAILTGGIIKNPDGSWRTTNFNEKGDKYGMVGDRIRVEAAYYLQRAFQHIPIVIIGGKGLATMYEGAPAISDVIADELFELGVKRKMIKLVKKPKSTFGSIVEIPNIIKRLKLKKILVITNKYHLPRVTRMARLISAVNNLEKAGRISFVAAEDIALKFEKAKWQERIKKAYTSKLMAKRVSLEKKGLQALESGTYHFKETI